MSYNRAPSQSSSGLPGEKREMQELNDKLSAYIQRVRQLRQQAGANIDPASFLDTLKLMEEDMARLKATYEQELGKLRKQLDAMGSEKGLLVAKASQSETLTVDLQGKLSTEADKARRALDDVNGLRKALAQRDSEVAALRSALSAKDQEIDQVRPEMSKLTKEIEELRLRLQREAAARQQAEEASKQLQGKVSFDCQKYVQESKDLKERLESTNNIIATLQSKIKQLSNVDDANLDAILKKVRDGTAAELARYQRETEEALNKNLGTLKRQLDEDASAKARLASENERLEKLSRELQAKCASMEAEVSALLKRNKELEIALNDDRSKAAARIRELEQKLRELQELIMNKLRDNSEAQGAVASLRAEIDTYRVLLEGEEQRLLGSTNKAPAVKPAPVPAPVQSTTNPRLAQPQTTYQTSYKDHGTRTRYNSARPTLQRAPPSQP